MDFLNMKAEEKRRRQIVFVPVEIVEEWQEVESQFAPAFFLTICKDVGIHDGCWVIESWTAHHRPAHIPGLSFRGEKSYIKNCIFVGIGWSENISLSSASANRASKWDTDRQIWPLHN